MRTACFGSADATCRSKMLHRMRTQHAGKQCARHPDNPHHLSAAHQLRCTVLRRACDGGEAENADGAPSPDIPLGDPRVAKQGGLNAPEQVCPRLHPKSNGHAPPQARPAASY